MAEEDAEVQRIIATIDNEPDQIAAIAEVRGYFMPDDEDRIATITAYLSGDISLAITVNRLALPIEEAYTTANHGRAFWDAEQVRRSQYRFFPSIEEAAAQWGEPVALTEPDPARRLPSVEGHLWDLYYGILIRARMTSWEAGEQDKLIDLVRALKARPEPQRPDDPVGALRNDWIFHSGTLWSNLTLLGPSARESWNDSPGCGAGYALPEVHGWHNISAFVARLSAENIASFWNYGTWAMRDGLEDASAAKGKAEDFNVNVSTAAVWILAVGEDMYEPSRAGGQAEEVPVEARGKQMPWCRTEDWNLARWDFWRRKLEIMAVHEKLTDENRGLVARALVKIGSIENSAR